jgi:hemoglobin-like flavoprotein
VQTSWAKVEPISDAAADIFYGQMFSTHPEYRKLFPEGMAKQKKALMKMLAMAVKGITNLDELVPKVQDLGRRHAKVCKWDLYSVPVMSSIETYLQLILFSTTK